MKQKLIFALVLGAILVLTVSSIDPVFADYDKDDDRYDDDRYDDDRISDGSKTSEFFKREVKDETLGFQTDKNRDRICQQYH